MTTILAVLNYVECLLFFFQNMNTSGFRACVKELYGTRYDPLSVSYAVLTGLLITTNCLYLLSMSTVCFDKRSLPD